MKKKAAECKWCGRRFEPIFKRQVLCAEKCLKRSRRQRHAERRARARELTADKRKNPKMWGEWGEPGWIRNWVDHDCDRDRCDGMKPNLTGYAAIPKYRA